MKILAVTFFAFLVFAQCPNQNSKELELKEKELELKEKELELKSKEKEEAKEAAKDIKERKQNLRHLLLRRKCSEKEIDGQQGL